MFFVYIIYSTKLNRYYIGTTDDINRRLNEHNIGFYEKAFTFKGVPWELKLAYKCSSSVKAYELERFIKKQKSRVFIEKLINDNLILKDIESKL